ncbi:uncharacterized protein [Argopecten irradians]|uniref:uncharacterized protein n=1 Tax=Argopecten irradians TaxID=31199 RepID=UPI00371A61F9
MAACGEVAGPCESCDILTYMVILLSMVTVCLVILSTGLYLRTTSQKNIENVMKKYRIQDEGDLEKTLMRHINQGGMKTGGLEVDV